MSELWERQSWDTSASYERFKEFYLPQDAARRSLDEAYRRYYAAQNGLQAGDLRVASRRPPGAWQRWFRGQDSSGNSITGAVGWDERARAYDAHLARQEFEQFERDRLRNKKQRMRVLEGALAQLTLVWSQLDYRPKLDANGRLSIPDLPPFKDATNALRIVMEQLRAEYGDEPVHKVAVTDGDGRPLAAGPNYGDMSDDDLFDDFSRAMAAIAPATDGEAGGAGSGDGAAQTGTNTDPLADGGQ